MEQSLKGRAALVSGSTSGIGLAIATGLAEAGADVMLNGFGEAVDIERIKEDLSSRSGARVLHHGADMSIPSDIADLIAHATDAFGGIDILVNNAGIQFVAPIEEFPPEKWDAIIAINLSAAFHTIRHALGGMKERGWGRIINISSTHGLVSSPFKSAYAAAKHGIIGLTKTVALETAEQGITVNAICPGYVLTPLVEKQIPDLARSRGLTEDQVKRDVMLHAQPIGKFVTVEEISALTVFLCSPGAVSITGAALTIDGGCTAQ
jgi:3-hydroxybutyrate dehydrogenase